MNLAWIAALSLFVLVEKIIPRGDCVWPRLLSSCGKLVATFSIRSIGCLTNDPKLRQRVAEFLRKQGEDLAEEQAATPQAQTRYDRTSPPLSWPCVGFYDRR
jgi:hypothetical protein